MKDTNKLTEEKIMQDIALIIEETTGATMHFYYSKQKSKWVCWYGFQKFIISDNLPELLDKSRKYLLNNRIKTGYHYKMFNNNK